MHLHVIDFTGIVIHLDIVEACHKPDLVDRLVVLLQEFVALRRSFVIVERHAGTDHVQHHRPLVRNSRLQHREQLLLVAGKRAPNERRAQLNRHGAGIDGRQLVDHAGLQLRPDVGRGRELALGQAVHAVVLDDVNHGQVADRSRVAVAGDAQRSHRVVGQYRARSDARHAPVHAVKTERAIHKIRGALRRAADAAHLHYPLRLHAHLPHGFDNALADCVVAAPGAQR